MADVTAITVTYGLSESLDRMCGSLSRRTRDGSRHAIHHVVVTQPDESGERATVPSTAREIRVDENLGFAAGNNLAVKESTSEFIAFLNPDLELTEGWLDPLIEALSDNGMLTLSVEFDALFFESLSKPERLLDTRSGDKVGELDGSGAVYELQVAGSGGVPSSGVSAVALNVTAVSTKVSDVGGFVTVFPCGTRPDASNLNFTSGMTIVNSVIAPVSGDGKVCFYVYGKAHLLADINGYLPMRNTSGLRRLRA